MTRRPLSEVHFPVQYIEITESLVRSRGGPVAKVREHCGLPPAGSPQTPATIDGHQLQASMLFGRDYCLPGEPSSLQALRHFPLTAHGMLGMLTIASQTVGEALDAALRYHSLVMPLFEMRRLPDTPQGAVVRVEQVVDFAPLNDQVTEMVIGVCCNVAPYTDGLTPNLAVSFRHQPQGDPAAYEAFFGQPVRFGAEYNGFTVGHELLRSPLITGNRATRDLLEAELRRQAPEGTQLKPLAQRVRRLLADEIGQRRLPSAERIAEALAMSPRTLSRKLKDEGESLSGLLDALRIEQAEQLLDGRRSVQEVARLVGFADASSFARAFKRATGRTPAEVRERAAGLGPLG